MTIDQDQLAATLADARAKAEAALSPDDRWHLADDGSVWVDHGGQGSSASCLVETFPIWAKGMPEHIARMDPATTLLLLDAVDTLQAENKRHATIRDRQRALWRLMEDRAELAEAEAADLRAAARRSEGALTECRAQLDRQTEMANREREAAADLRTRLDNVRALAERWESEDVDDIAADDSYDPALALRAALDGPQDGGDGR